MQEISGERGGPGRAMATFLFLLIPSPDFYLFWIGKAMW